MIQEGMRFSSDRLIAFVCTAHDVVDLVALSASPDKELLGHLWKHGVGQNIFFLFNIFCCFLPDFVKFRIDQVGGTGCDRLFISKDYLLNVGIDRRRGLTVFALDQGLRFLGHHLVALAGDDVP